ncbi:MAG: hypothetical protein JWP95_2260 [Actinotalea sp.]|nr:hypothetical protein [Actinotalea sp.]
MAISPISIGTSTAPGSSTEAAASAGGCGCGGCGCGADDASALATPSDARTAGVDTAAVVAAADAATTTTYGVVGMTCGHCVSSVTEEISSLPGVTDVQVELVVDGRSTVTVQSAAPLDETDVRAAIDEAGYQLAGQA